LNSCKTNVCLNSKKKAERKTHVAASSVLT
jgi:hypothetical protein